MIRRTRIVLRCYPQEDTTFLSDAQRAVAESRATIRRAERLMEAVQAKLRSHYPQAVIHAQSALAAEREDEKIWYVYRDGRMSA